MRGYVAQYRNSAAAIYDALSRDDLVWVGLADRGAGIADDVVLGLKGRVVGHQFKASQYPEPFRLDTLFFGASGLFAPLVESWRLLVATYPDETVEIRLVTDDYPSTSGKLVASYPLSHTAAFLNALDAHQADDIAGLRASLWAPWIDRLERESGLPTAEFERFLSALRVLSGSRADFLRAYRIGRVAAEEVGQIADRLPSMVADRRGRDQWTRQEFLEALGWPDSFGQRRSHRFPLGRHVQRNVATEQDLAQVIAATTQGYVAVIGPPGSGKSTTLQSALASHERVVVVRYLAFMPGEGQGIGRAEAEDFLDDINSQLKQSGLNGLRLRVSSLKDRQEEFEALFKSAGERFIEEGVRTLIVVDGLDHVPREETPYRSLLAELPLPAAVPEGILFVLGTQRLDLPALKPQVQAQAATDGRRVTISPLSREVVCRMADALGLDSEIDRARIAEIGQGHPLATRYLIEALRSASPARQIELLDGSFPFAGDIEAVYEAAWREVGEDVQAVIAFIARAEGAIPPALLARAVSEVAVEQTLRSVRHLLEVGEQGWSVFHNSFRLFILGKPKLRFGEVDAGYDAAVYAALAELTCHAGPTSAQRWLEVRYRAHAGQDAAVLQSATAARYRAQLADGRSEVQILGDLRLAFAAAGRVGNATDLFRLLLVRDEIERRSRAMEYAPSLVAAYLAIGDLGAARTYAEVHNTGGFEIVDALLAKGDIEGARRLFDRIEPTTTPSGKQAHSPDAHQDQVEAWAARVHHFRDTDQIHEAIDRFAAEAKIDSWREFSRDDFAANLRWTVAHSAISIASADADAVAIARALAVEEIHIADLLVAAGDRALALGEPERAKARYAQAQAHPAFAELGDGLRRRLALTLADLGEVVAVRALFADIAPIGVAAMRGEIGDDAAIRIARAIGQQAQLATYLGEDPGLPPPAGAVLTPLQLHLATAGALLGRAQAGRTVASGEVTRAAKAALAYLDIVKAEASDEFYAMHQLAAAAPGLVQTLIAAAWRAGKAEFQSVLSEFDQTVAKAGANAARLGLRRVVASTAYRYDGDQAAAARRLAPIADVSKEGTPGEQVELMATLAVAFAEIGDLGRARDLIRASHAETLGYATPAKKDPQYLLWRELLVRANAADPAGRRDRVDRLARVVRGMMDTEGRDAGYRLAADLLVEAATCDAAFGLAHGRALVEAGALSWDQLVNALLLGAVRREPALASPCAALWATLCLPYYDEPFYRDEALGQFIVEAVGAAPPGDLAGVVELFTVALEADSKPEVRAELFAALCSAAEARDVRDPGLLERDERWRREAPPTRQRNTPGAYDEIATLADLQAAFLAAEDGQPSYDGESTFARLVKIDTDLDLGVAMFRQWPTLQAGNRARFALADAALAAGEVALAAELASGYAASDDRGGVWSVWMGGGKLRYFRTRVAIEGTTVRREAFADFAEGLAAGREFTSSLLAESDEIFPLIADAPDWPAMWAHVAEGLAVTREFKCGADLPQPAPLSDAGFILALLRWALSLAQVSLDRAVRLALEQLPRFTCGTALAVNAIAILLGGEADEPLFALQALAGDGFDTARVQLVAPLQRIAAGVDFLTALAAERVLTKWDEAVPAASAPLPAFYSLELAAAEDTAATFGPGDGSRVLGDNPLIWVNRCDRLIRRLARGQVTASHIHRRCAALIDGWGGTEAFGRPQFDRIQIALSGLELRLPFHRPDTFAVLRALRQVVGEMRLAGLINRGELDYLVRKFTSLDLGETDAWPAPRPQSLLRPSAPEVDYLQRESRWLNGVERDVAPLSVGGMMVLAELYSFDRTDFDRRFELRRVRAPMTLGDSDLSGDDWAAAIPEGVWFNGTIASPEERSSSLVRIYERTELGGVPGPRLTICPHWLRTLGWRRRDRASPMFLDATGRRVAEVIWWRDGLPQDVREHGFWSDGMLLLATVDGGRQLVAHIGPFDIVTRAARLYRKNRRAPAEVQEADRRHSIT